MAGSRRWSQPRCRLTSRRRTRSTWRGSRYSSDPGTTEVFNDRAFDAGLRLERLVAHLQILVKRLVKRVELATPRVELRQLASQEFPDVAASRAPGVRLMTH